MQSDMDKVVNKLAIQNANLMVENAKLAVLLEKAQEENEQLKADKGEEQ